MNRNLTTLILAFIFALASSFTLAAEPAKPLPREEWGAPPVKVTNSDGKWTIAGKKQTATLTGADLALTIQAGPTTWKMVPSGPNDMLVQVDGKEFPLRLADAGKIEIVPYDTGYKTGVKITLSDWKQTGADKKPVDLTLYLTLGLEGRNEELAFDVVAVEDKVKVRQLNWPMAMDPSSFDATVLSNVRGVLLPRDWPKPYHPIRELVADGSQKYKDEKTEVQSNIIESWCMSWWGFQKGAAAMMIIIETPDDAAYQFEHPAGGPTVIGPRWRPQLGKLGYVRSGRMVFFPQGNYVDLAKRYRQYAKDTGLFVSLQEKIARKPAVAELIGTPLVRLGVLTNIKEDSLKYNKENPERNHRMTSFDERAKQLQGWKAMGLERLCVCLTGWPNLGYDRQHPDELPPAPEAGGWEGMKRLADACRGLGYQFTLHDQYRDYYTDAPSFDEQFAVHEEAADTVSTGFPGSRFGQWKKGRVPYMNNWDGGTMAYMNNRLMPGHLQKNYQGLFDHGIRPDGVYLDVFGYVPPDEDFNQQHPTSRTDAIRARTQCYHWAGNNIGLVGTEAACDWTVPFSDFSSPLTQDHGIAIPLFGLVYHDAIFTTYSPNDLHGLLNGGMAQMGGRRDFTADDLTPIRRMANLQKRLALVEMTRHEFLDDKYRKERTAFADGTTVTVDWDTKKVEISPELE